MQTHHLHDKQMEIRDFPLQNVKQKIKRYKFKRKAHLAELEARLDLVATGGNLGKK